ncbi:ISKra4 family transposase [Hyphomicrobium sp.]|uniref:ISKra4 family transposase n=1 Tax=Hyphomicrobium sp. TaxID=82 RepID=UPI0025B93AE8|nr:ISKra4 family transposase [Hyphomicrobium sp.]MCC7251977.1 ISKra4 family transposase [Hyphomicrobium sp.]
MEAQADLRENPFLEPERAFGRLRDKLGAAETAAMTHGEVEALIDVEGREVLRQLFQSHLDVRSGREVVHTDVCGADDVVRTLHRDGARKLETLLGTVALGRQLYGAVGHASLAPLDAELSMPKDLFSDGVQRRVADGAAQLSFDEVTRSVRATTGAEVAKRQAERLTVGAAVDFDAFYAERAVEPSSADALLVMSFDGKGVVMRKGHLRAATAEAASRRTHKLKRRLSKGEKKNLRRMATVAAIWSVTRYVRTPEQIVREMQPVHEVPPARPRPTQKRVSASLEKDPEQVVAEYFEEALRRDPDRKRRWAVLVDGAETQLGLVLGCAKAAGVEVTVVLDIIHVIEYLWEAALCFHAEGTKAAETWVSERLLEILRGRASTVAAGMRRSATKRRLKKTQRRGVDKCAGYLLSHKEFLRYDEYLRAGLPIATGVIEGACRYLVKDRMDITGARWGLPGAEAVLKLRALRASGDFDAYWAFHRRQEHERNHLRLYAGNTPPRASGPQRPAASRADLRLVKQGLRPPRVLRDQISRTGSWEASPRPHSVIAVRHAAGRGC